MSASAVPQPIVNSIYVPTTPSSSANPSVHTDDTLLLFRRKQRELEARLQVLLDAQADALLSGLDASPTSAADDDGLSTGSSTPTVSVLNPKPHTSSKSEKIDLRHARVGLYATIRRLAQLKSQESEYLAPSLNRFASVVDQLDAWQKKRSALQSRASQIRSGDDQNRAQDLHKQADDMQSEIDELETKLARLKGDQRKLRAEAQEIENSVDASLASYTSALAMVEGSIKTFLHDASASRLTAVVNVVDMDRFWRSPPRDRTLKSAKDVFGRERDSLVEKRRISDTEREALEDGAVMWKDTVKQVTNFERTLSKAMSRVSRNSQSQLDDSPAETKELLTMLEQTTTELENKHKLAEERSWKLLVAAIGAELEAFLKGKQILEAALASVDGNTTPEEPRGTASSSGQLEGTQTPRGGRHDDGEAIRDLDKAFAAKRPTQSISDTDTEDDGPDPELLISHQDTDTE
jgi:molecular chaperone GrpE (heat shock protein)